MTNEELLRDYISYHYVEGNITKEQRVKMEFAAASYLQKIEQLTIPAVVGQSEQLKAFGKSLQYKGVRILTDEGVEQAVKDFESL